ncbi:hypothetical protein BDY21DRAFT_206548 [Lineolata rhizophorae]|uniref:Glycosyltransferase family 31 protein n=1 Tax=Lineolata rhizophorae TaxID=578093 RepID=A0A6A6P468_9PEZI|nr:hypothetical protein BDY21DRAFT_206548 [Lineolata rhizophorae]
MPPLTNRWTVSVVAAFFIVTLLFASRDRQALLQTLHHQRPTTRPLPVPGSHPSGCAPSTSYLKEQLHMNSSIKYARAEMVVDFAESATVEKTLDATMPIFHMLDLDGGSSPDPYVPEPCPNPIRVTLPPSPRKTPDASHLIFGVATRADRLLESLDQFAHWAGHTSAKIVAIIEPAPEDVAAAVGSKAGALGLELEIEQSDDSFNDRYYQLTRAIFQRADKKTQWGIVIDDDTFFPSMAALVDYLAGYDASREHYIGGMTENFEQLKKHGIMAYGGGGVFLSKPLLARLESLYDTCYPHPEVLGDMRISNCVHSQTLTKLTAEPRLHQLDMRGDLSGWYESGREPRPLSLHHWKSWHAADVLVLAAADVVTGYEGLLRRWRFADGWWLTNGYSVVRYGRELPADDVSMERTWLDDGAFLHSLAPLRPKDEGKVSLRLEGVALSGEGEDTVASQFYVQWSTEGSQEVARVLEVVWRRARGSLERHTDNS